MNRDKAKQLLPIIQALADGKKIQFYQEATGQWKDSNNPAFTFAPNHYRIKPETIKIEHRRFLYKYSAYLICICSSKEEAKSIINNPNFVRWIDSDWITEEVEINNHD